MLAAGGNIDDGTIKLIVGAIAVVFWIVGQLVTKAKSKPTPPKLPRRPTETPADWPRTPPARGPVVRGTQNVPQRNPSQRNKSVPPMRPQPAAMRNSAPPMRQQPVSRQQPVAVPQPQPAVRPQLTVPRAVQRSPQRIAAEPAATRSPAVQQRQATLGLLLRPQNLKAAFILTEVLRPPLALRDGQGDLPVPSPGTPGEG